MVPVTSINPTGPSTGEETPATPTPAASIPPPTERPEKRDRAGGCLPWVLAIAVLFGIFAVWKFPSLKAQAELGSAYAARIGCSCRYVQGRSLDSCQTDFEPGMEMVSLSEDPATRTVTGSVPLLASRSARYAGASGCLLAPEN